MSQLSPPPLPTSPATLYQPEFLYPGDPGSEVRLHTLRRGGAVVYDLLPQQLQELVKCLHPAENDPLKLEEFTKKHINNTPPETYGVWVYYPWSNRLVHLLDEAEFALVRTNRNQHKISPEEQAELGQKIVGIIGLSVGQSVALTLALERGFGELRIADFDTLDLSNLNRLRAGVHELGLNKAVIAARQIAELDPFLKVRVFTEGITPENMTEFFTGGGRLDLLIEECDNLDIKIKCRQQAAALGVPVIMDTSDRGMLDVERFDLEPGRPLFHGLLGAVNSDSLAGMPPAERLQLVLQIAGGAGISERGRASLQEVGKTIRTWPQLGAAVTMGGGVAADVSRRLLLGGNIASGRYYIDTEELIPQ